MKRLLIALFSLLCTISVARADHDAFGIDGIPKPNMRVTSGVNFASATTIITPSVAVVVSSYSCSLFTVVVSSPGISAGTPAQLEIWNSQTTTGAALTAQLVSPIDTTVRGTYGPYDAWASSGICIYNQGGTPAKITINIRER